MVRTVDGYLTESGKANSNFFSAHFDRDQMAYCSPSSEKVFERDKTCFTKEALARLAEAWNEEHPDQKITGIERASKKKLWDDINGRMFGICKGSGREWCWVDKLQKAKSSPEVSKSLRPQRPREWYKKPYTWLSNFDIEAVMRQYQDDPDNRYKFLGVYPLDFAAKSMFGTCLFREICSLDVAKMMKGKKKVCSFGMITNLDYHDEDGSHWTSLFVCIDPKLPTFGAYYYDSVAPSQPPKEIQDFMGVIKTQAEAVAKTIPGCEKAVFRLDHNRRRHQYGNSECGLFSMAYQIRWIDKLRKNPMSTNFDEVAHIKLTDEDVHKLRDILFRPNTKEVVGGVKKKRA